MTITPTRITFPDRRQIVKDFAEIRPFGGAGFIMADPCWQFQDWSDNGDKSKSIEAQYRTQPLDWIMQLPVCDLAARDCVLMLWATNPMLPEALQTMDAWGFAFKTAGTWVKYTNAGRLAFGSGRRLRSSNEPFLIGVRGSPKVRDRAIRSVICSGEKPTPADQIEALTMTLSEARREHSRKPESAYEMANRMAGHETPKIDLFSRCHRAGWAAWGDETEKFGDAFLP